MSYQRGCTRLVDDPGEFIHEEAFFAQRGNTFHEFTNHTRLGIFQIHALALPEFTSFLKMAMQQHIECVESTMAIDLRFQE